MTKIKIPHSKRQKSNLSLLNIKVSPEDRKLLVRAAKKHANGNISAWLRTAGMYFKPTKRTALVVR